MAMFHLVFISLVTVSLAVYAPKSKKGDCPSTITVGRCSDCSSDYDCQGTKKCCLFNSGSCSSYCVLPVFGGVRPSGGIGTETVEIITRRVVTSGGGDGGVLRGGVVGGGVVGGVDNISGGGVRRVIETVDVGGVSGIGRVGGHGGVIGKRVSNVGAGGVEEFFDDGLGGGAGRTVIETVRVAGPSVGVGSVVRGDGGLTQKVIVKTIGGAGGRIAVVDDISSRSGSGGSRGVEPLIGVSGRSGVIGGSKTIIRGGCAYQCIRNSECGKFEYCENDGCCRARKNGYQ